MFYVKSHSWRRMALNEGTTHGSGSHNVLDASQGCAYTGKRRTYGSQLVRRHCGICRSYKSRERRRWRTAVSIYNPKNNKHTFPLKTQQGSGSPRLSSGQLKEHGEQREWVVWSRKWEWNNVLYYARGIKMKH